MTSPDIYETIDRLSAVPFSGVGFRHVAPHVDCRSAEGARQFGGRWNPPNSFPVLYIALSIESVAAEFLRMAARNARPPGDFLPRDVCTLEIELERVLDLRTPQALRTVGLDPARIHGHNLVPSQQVGDAAHKLAFEGILAPSATGVGETLVVFELKLRKGSRVVQRARASWNVLSDLPRL